MRFWQASSTNPPLQLTEPEPLLPGHALLPNGYIQSPAKRRWTNLPQRVRSESLWVDSCLFEDLGDLALVPAAHIGSFGFPTVLRPTIHERRPKAIAREEI